MEDEEVEEAEEVEDAEGEVSATESRLARKVANFGMSAGSYYTPGRIWSEGDCAAGSDLFAVERALSVPKSMGRRGRYEKATHWDGWFCSGRPLFGRAVFVLQ